MLKQLLCVMSVLLPLTLADAPARVWYVSADGTGDAPTIQAAFDSSAAGDLVLVGPGTFYEHDIVSKPFVSLHSELGAAETTIDAAGGYDGILGAEHNAPWDVDGFTVFGAEGAGIAVRGGGSQTIRECVTRQCGAGIYAREFDGIIANVTAVGGVGERPSGSGFSFTYSNPVLLNCISAFNQGYGVVCWDMWYDPTLTCCCVYGNAGGNFDGLPDPTGSHGNISQDPLFCDFGTWDLHLAEDSPCAPFSPPNPQCDLIGALPVGCGPTPSAPATWGQVKMEFLGKTATR
jgi:hypothetical protein